MATDPYYNDFDSGNLEGDILMPGSQLEGNKSAPFDTLDEPIRDTILRDVKAVGTKFFHVFYPKQKTTLLKDWDLWGPLILCIFLAMMLQSSTDAKSVNDGGPEFAQVFVIVWVGAVIVTLNSKLLGGKISFFQSVCVLGYCLLPPAVALVICKIMLLFHQSLMLFIIRFFVTMLGFAWATFASMAFLGNSQPPHRKALAVYPMCLFYFVISWLVLSHTRSA